MILTFTDFGYEGPYLGQMLAVLHAAAPGHAIVNLMADAPRFNPKAASYLLAAVIDSVPEQAVVVSVVDPDVGGKRVPMVVQTSKHWLVGPDNGVMEMAWRQNGLKSWRIEWRPKHLTATFHGRDLFAPMAAKLATNPVPEGYECALQPLSDFSHWPDDVAEIVYIDAFGNAMTGWRGSKIEQNQVLCVNGHDLVYALRFGAVEDGIAFWYVNSCGLVEIAVNGGNAALKLSLKIGVSFQWKNGHEIVVGVQRSI